MSSISLSSLPIPLQIALQTGGAGSQWISLLPMVAIFAIFYFLLVAPMRKRQRSLQQLVEGLKKGDRVVTTGGLYGEIAAVDAATVILKVADNVKLKVAKSAIAGLEGDGDKGVKP
jgi:preprotein translocase subunit YajC